MGELDPSLDWAGGCWLHWEAGPTRDAQPLPSASPDYIRPTPTPRSGYHRYQFRLYRQPANATIALTREERVSFCKDQLCVPPDPTPHPEGFPAGTGNAVCWGVPKMPARGCSCGAKGLGILTRDMAGVSNPLQTSTNSRQNIW